MSIARREGQIDARQIAPAGYGGGHSRGVGVLGDDNHAKLKQLGWVLTAQVVALGLTSIGILSIFVGR